MRRQTLIDFFNDFAGLHNPFLVYDDGFRVERYRYSETASQARAFSAYLKASGIGPGEKIIIYAENRPEWLFALWGAILAGVIVVPIDYRSAPDFVERIKQIVNARLVYTGEPFQGEHTAEAAFPATSGTTAEIIFTSGATAEPKGVVLTHGNILANIVPVEREILKYRKYAKPFAPIRFLNLLPLSHMFGQAMATHIPPMLPGVVVFMRGYNPAEIVHQIHSRRISVLVSVPKVLEILREYVVRRFPELERPARNEIALADPLVAVPQGSSAVRIQVLELHCRRGSAFSRSGAVLVGSRISRHPRLRPDRDGAHRCSQSSLPRAPGQRRIAHRGSRGENRG